jgi:hypothetical protein
MGMLDQRGEMFWIKYYSADRPILERTGTMASGVIRYVLEEHFKQAPVMGRKGG